MCPGNSNQIYRKSLFVQIGLMVLEQLPRTTNHAFKQSSFRRPVLSGGLTLVSIGQTLARVITLILVAMNLIILFFIKMNDDVLATVIILII